MTKRHLPGGIVNSGRKGHKVHLKKKNFLEPLSIRKDIKKRMNKRLIMDGLKLLSKLDSESIRVGFFDPAIFYSTSSPASYKEAWQFHYRHSVSSMYEPVNQEPHESKVVDFLNEYNRIIVPNGFLFMWADEWEFFINIDNFLVGKSGEKLDFIKRHFITWDVGKVEVNGINEIHSFYDVSNLLILQKPPGKTEGYWFDTTLTDIYASNKKEKTKFTKPIDLQARLIEASTLEGDLIVDAAAGSFSVLKACRLTGRNFLGCDCEKGNP